MLNKFPQTFTFILINNRYSLLFRFFYQWPICYILPTLIFFRKWAKIEFFIQINASIIFCKIHIAISENMID